MENSAKSRSREEIRKRNREIIDRANAELRSEVNPSVKSEQPISRFPLTKNPIALPHLHSSVQFGTGLPSIELGPIRCDHSLDAKDFAYFDSNPILLESLRESLLSREEPIFIVDLINMTTSNAQEGLGIMSCEDGKLLKDDVPSFAQRDALDAGYRQNFSDSKKSRTDTAHFLRRPQMLTSEASTAFMYSNGKGKSNTEGEAASEVFESQFKAARDISDCAMRNDQMLHPVTNKRMKLKRCLKLVPFSGRSCDTAQQVKFDENPDIKTQNRTSTACVNSSIITSMVTNDTNETSYKFYTRDISNMEYTCVRQYAQPMEWSTRNNDVRDDFFIVSLPGSQECDQAFVGAVGRKMLLRKSLQANIAEKLQLTIAEA